MLCFVLIISVLLNLECFGILIVFSIPVACCKFGSRISVLFCSLIKGITPKIRMLSFALNSHFVFCPKFACCVSRSFEPCMCLDPARVLPTRRQFCSLIKGIAPKIRMLCFAIINSVLLNLACVWILLLFYLPYARCRCRSRIPVLFCSLIKGITPKICMLCFLLINSVLLNLVCFGILIVFSLPVACCRFGSRILVLFCSSIKGITAKIRMLCFVLNSHAVFCVLLNLVCVWILLVFYLPVPDACCRCRSVVL